MVSRVRSAGRRLWGFPAGRLSCIGAPCTKGHGALQSRNLQLKPDTGRTRATLGRKGIETRARLLRATRELLHTVSPFNITVAAIAKAAKTVPGTLYVYFDDVSAVFYELSVEASEDFQAMLEANAGWFTERARFVTDARSFVNEFNRVWDEHSHVLHYRNMEADRGNNRFLVLRLASSVQIINRLAEAIIGARPFLTKMQARAEAVVLYSAVERISASRVSLPSDRPGPPASELVEAQVRVIAHQLGVEDRELRTAAPDAQSGSGAPA